MEQPQLSSNRICEYCYACGQKGCHLTDHHIKLRENEFGRDLVEMDGKLRDIKALGDYGCELTAKIQSKKIIRI